MKFFYLVLPLLLSVLNVAVEAKAYRWVDNNGNVHYSDRKPRGKAKAIKPKVVSIQSHGASLPNIEVKKPISYNKSTPSQAIKLGLLELKLPGANYRDIKIGNTYSGKRCNKKDGELYWVQGNGFMDDIRMSRVLVSKFNHAGYRLYRENEGLTHPNSRLLLKTQLVKLKLNRCISREAFRKVSKDEAYLKIKWVLEDSLSKKIIFKGHSTGLYKGFGRAARTGGTSQAIDRALSIAANNILANRELVTFLSRPSSTVAKKNNFELLPLNIKYSNEQKTFKAKIKELQKSTVTIRNTKGHGSGVFVTRDGFILTNAHVVGNDNKVIVILQNKEVEATVVRVEPIRDIALLKINKNIKVSSSQISKQDPDVGDTLFVIGTPLSEELSHTVTSGILSAKRVSDGMSLYQTDASINKGNSGGPIYNDKGELVAISVSAIFNKHGATMGLNYLIPIEDALDSLNISRKRMHVLAMKQQKLKENRTFDTNDVPRKEKNNELTSTKKDVFKNGVVLTLYGRSLKAKNQRKFDTAESLLKRAITLIPKQNKSSNARLVRDEFYYFLPIARAKEAITNKNPKEALKQAKSVEKYIVGHPKQFAFLKEIATIKESVSYLKKTLAMISREDVRRDLDYVKYFLLENYADTEQLPDTRYALSSLLEEKFGHRFTNQYDLVSYKPEEDRFTIVFRRLSNNSKVTISERFQ